MMKRLGVDLTDVQQQADPNRRPRRMFLLGAGVRRTKRPQLAASTFACSKKTVLDGVAARRRPSLRGEGCVDPRLESRFERTSLDRDNAFKKLRPVLAAEHDRVDGLHGQRIAVSERGRRHTKLPGQSAECSTPVEVFD